MILEACLKNRLLSLVACCMLLGATALAQTNPRLSIETSQPMFAVLASLNACGFSEDLNQSLPIRAQIRTEVLSAARSPEAQEALRAMCTFYDDHRQNSDSRTLSQYISLALNLEDGGGLALKNKEADLPPDAVFVLGFLPLMQKFNATADLNKIWEKHRPDYERIIATVHQPLNDTLLSTDFYLKRAMSSYRRHEFLIYVDPQAAPGEVNARNYGDDYYVVVSPSSNGSLNLDQIRHTYLHYILDPMAQSRGTTLERLKPLLMSVRQAPLEDAYRFDISLLLTESLIKAVEAHLSGGPKGPEEPRQQLVWNDMRQGYILTRYFYDQLTAYKNDEVNLDQGYATWLHDIDIDREAKRASTIPFASSAEPELVRKPQQKQRQLLVDLAERALQSGNLGGAKNYAQQAIQNKEDTGRANFVLARVSTAEGDMAGAQAYFQRAASFSDDPKITGWSHIYLGRILDMQKQRQEAVDHYKTALNGAGTTPEIRAAAEKGLQQPYQSPVKHPAD